MHDAVCNGLQPDLTILLLPPLAASLQRARRRNSRHSLNENRFESESDEFYRRIHAAYCAIAAREPGRVTVIADQAPIEVIEERIRTLVTGRLPAPCISSTTP
jgi:dTMP kinase